MKLGLILGSVSVVTLGVGAGLVTSISAYSNLEEFIRKIPATTTVSDLSFTKEQIDSEAYTKDLKQQKLDYRKISDLQVEMSY
jgi:hypothetical protein